MFLHVTYYTLYSLAQLALYDGKVRRDRSGGLEQKFIPEFPHNLVMEHNTGKTTIKHLKYPDRQLVDNHDTRVGERVCNACRSNSLRAKQPG